jgi:hypothetical protein
MMIAPISCNQRELYLIAPRIRLDRFVDHRMARRAQRASYGVLLDRLAKQSIEEIYLHVVLLTPGLNR